MNYKSIYTKAGLGLLSAAQTGQPLILTHMAIGDGNGWPVEPDQTQESLIRELYRGALNRLYQPDSADPTVVRAELVLPANVTGLAIREVGVFDAAGTLVVVGNAPLIEVPAEGEGAFSQPVIRIDFRVSNAASITLISDPNVVVVTQQWIANNITLGYLLPGGVTGQLLAKASNADGDVEWIDLGEGISVSVDTIAEKQVLADAQTVVDLSTVTTYGLAVYINGVRIDQGAAAAEWEPDATLATRLHLGQSYAAGDRITLVQNEPAGSARYPLQRDLNLADVTDVAAARQNLSVLSDVQTREMAPPGTIMHTARQTSPSGWLRANGSAVSRTAYADLFAAIGTTFGEGDGINTFNLPDLRGEFIRGIDDGRGVDVGRILGSSQSAQIGSHQHDLPTSTSSSGSDWAIADSIWTRVTANSQPVTGEYARTFKTGGPETRPRNVALLACIKF